MKLSQMIAIASALLLTLLITAIFYVSVINARTSVNQQLEANAQDMVKLVSGILTPDIIKVVDFENAHPQDNIDNTSESIALKRKVDVLFDTGSRYSMIKVVTLREGQHEKQIAYKNFSSDAIESSGAPLWFVHAIHLNRPLAEIGVGSNWSPDVAKVSIQLSPEYVYLALWDHAKIQVFTIGGLGLLTILALILLIRIISRPLAEMKKQALNISARRFTIQKLPFATDLRAVASAMNQMSLKIKNTIESLAKVSLLLRDKANQDNLTKLANYPYFRRRLHDLLRSEKDFINGVLFFGRISKVDEIHAQQGRATGTQAILMATNELKKLINQVYGSFAAYISQGEFDIPFGTFAIVAPNLDLDTGKKLASQLLALLKKETGFDCHVGIVNFQDYDNAIDSPQEVKRNTEKLISQGITALSQAARETSGIAIISDDIRYTNDDLVHILKNAIDTQSFVFERQAIQSTIENDHHVLHYELLPRIVDPKGHMVCAAAFKKIAVDHQLAIPFDQAVIKSWIRYAKAHLEDHDRYAISLSYSALESAEFRGWLHQTLQSIPELCSRLIFQLYEHYVQVNLENTKKLIPMLKSHGCACGIDRACREFDSMDYLLDLSSIDYITISGGNIAGIAHKPDNQLLLASLIDFIHELDIDVIAEQVDTMEDYQFLKTLSIEGMVGYLTEKASAI